MRVMVLVKATDDSEKGFLPTPEAMEAMEAMGRFNDELRNAGIMLVADGLKPSAQGKRIAFDGPGRTVIDGPFAETRELGACLNSRCSILSESDSTFGYEQVFSALEYRSDAASAAECAGLRAERPCVAVYR